MKPSNTNKALGDLKLYHSLPLSVFLGIQAPCIAFSPFISSLSSAPLNSPLMCLGVCTSL